MTSALAVAFRRSTLTHGEGDHGPGRCCLRYHGGPSISDETSESSASVRPFLNKFSCGSALSVQ